MLIKIRFILLVVAIHSFLYSTEMNIQKTKISEEMTFESYQVNSNTEDMGVGGFSYKRYLNNDALFFGGAGYGAISGQNSYEWILPKDDKELLKGFAMF
ncbi:MAG: hypothetical protein A2Y40_01455 [Candidatus Margulisbacteria bacterium GWF2_35_9]|nr:MAG: hypothetical protein A2Y40_01455 [Candidatus Margulisbacteria bacterium GWF2_35_9]